MVFLKPKLANTFALERNKHQVKKNGRKSSP